MEKLLTAIVYITGAAFTWWVGGHDQPTRIKRRYIGVVLAWPLAWGIAIIFAIYDAIKGSIWTRN